VRWFRAGRAPRLHCCAWGFLHLGGDFIVTPEGAGGESLVGEDFIAGGESTDEFIGVSGLAWFRHNIIGIIVIHYEKVFVASSGGNWISAG